MTADKMRILLAVHGRIDVTAVQRMLTDLGVTVAAVIDNDAEWAARDTYDANALVIACGGPSDAVLDLVDQEASSRSHLPIVVVSATSDETFVRQAVEAGADDLVLAPDLSLAGPQLLFALQKAATRRISGAAPRGEAGGQLIAVLGPKGGTGKTLTASNLAVALATEGKRVALVDLDLQFGDLGLVLGVAPDRTSFELANSGGTLDADKLDAFLTTHDSGVRLLLAPTRPDQAAAVRPEFLRELYPVLREAFDYVVVDTPPGFTPEVIATIDAATGICLIATLDVPSLKNAKLGAETLELMGYSPSGVRVVLNRADTNVGVTHADVVSVLGRAPDVLVPSSRDIVRSINAGEAIVLSSPRSEAAKAFRALAQIFLRDAAPSAIAVAEPRRRMRQRAGRQ